ncbi:Protein of unknown function [Bacillus mycoides]|uniref:Uncharacterized protein n=1 Tax=Bacillus mycoides TaxID=1405 RepID=A0A1C4BV45_BACMY|nr:Protein of unknown function [Bacillus mycoides]SCC10614.1 Protein of unknown function [Bacillus mycoides]SCM86407.1 Protein of unknown function [Bacillus mycoides]
MNNEMMNRVD